MNKYIIYNLEKGEWIEKEIISFKGGRRKLIRKLYAESSEYLSILGTWKIRKLME